MQPCLWFQLIRQTLGRVSKCLMVNAQTVVMHACSNCMVCACRKLHRGGPRKLILLLSCVPLCDQHTLQAQSKSLAACLLANPLGAFKQLSQAMPTCACRIQVSVSKKPLYFYVNLAKARRLPPPPSVRSSPAYFCSLHVPAVKAGFLANTWCPQTLQTLCVLDQVKKSTIYQHR